MNWKLNLINTSEEPKGLPQVETESGFEHTDVPLIDFRSTKRRVLDVEKFY